MIPVIGILALDVGEICRRRIETVREKLRDKKCDRRLCAQERGGVIELINRRGHRGAHRCGMRLAQQHRHLAEDGAGLGDGGDHRFALQNIEPAAQQNIKPPGGLSFPDQQRIGRKRRFLPSDAMFKNRAHSGLHPDRSKAKPRCLKRPSHSAVPSA
ncbi:MAG: hypothetical protein OJF48_001144 [Afipia sp.]|nr:MAG: hypothetical protein OJF48_001144 [Afipia sp.]